MSSPTTDGYAAFLVTRNVTTFQGYGLGSYSFFDTGVPIYAAEAFSVPDAPGVQPHDLLTVFLNGVRRHQLSDRRRWRGGERGQRRPDRRGELPLMSRATGERGVGRTPRFA